MLLGIFRRSVRLRCSALKLYPARAAVVFPAPRIIGKGKTYVGNDKTGKPARRTLRPFNALTHQENP